MRKLTEDKDPALVLLLQKGSFLAFEKLFGKYGQKLFNFSFSYLKNQDDAGEVVQEVFLKIWLNRASLKADASFQSYLFTIAFNTIKKSFNRKAKQELFRLELVDILASEESTADYENNYQAVVTKLNLFIDEMPEKRKEIFIQRKQQGKPVRQIAREMGISVKTVENQITEAMKFIRKRFEEELPDGLLLFTLFFPSRPLISSGTADTEFF